MYFFFTKVMHFLKKLILQCAHSEYECPGVE